MLTVLSIAYALAPVRPDTAGGAEQILLALDRALVASGHRSLVVAAPGSQVNGTLYATSPLPTEFTAAARNEVEDRQRQVIVDLLRREAVDVIHCHGLDFAEHLPPDAAAVLVTLHLDADCYSPAALRRRGTWFNCVSRSQYRRFAPSEQMLPEIENGVPVAALAARHAKRAFVLALGRICPEKGFHLALDAAAEAGLPLLIAGEVFPYDEHERYFAEQIRPRLGQQARFLGAVGFALKRRLLSAARCVLIPSLVPETSSLVAMEALACGTPVIAFPAGALADIVEHEVTGFLVCNVRQMAEAIRLAPSIDPARCRHAAGERFAEGRMIERYFAYYRRLAAR